MTTKNILVAAGAALAVLLIVAAIVGVVAGIVLPGAVKGLAKDITKEMAHEFIQEGVGSMGEVFSSFVSRGAALMGGEGASTPNIAPFFGSGGTTQGGESTPRPTPTAGRAGGGPSPTPVPQGTASTTPTATARPMSIPTLLPLPTFQLR